MLTLLPSGTAQAATSNTLNFQARLQTAAGGIVADGNYNVQFNLYTTNTGGSSLWTETYLVSASQGVRVKNGYLTANLGSITAFSTNPNINWDQDLYLGITVRGTASCTFATTCTPADNEMGPNRLKLTAVPYAFKAGALVTGNGTLQSTLSIVQPTVGNQIFQIPDMAAAGTYTVLTSGNGVQLQTASPGTAQTGHFNVTGTGIVGTSLLTPLLDVPAAGLLSIGTGTSATGITIGNGSSTGTITLGQSTASNTINIGSANPAASATQTINIGTGTPGAGGKVAITIGSTGNASGITLNAGTTGISVNSDLTVNGSKSLTLSAGVGTFSQNFNTAGAGTAHTVTASNTSGIQTNGILFDRNGTGGTTNNGINITNTTGTLGNGLQFTGTMTNLINATSFSVTGGGDLTAAGTVRANTAFNINGTTGATITCTAGNFLQNATTVGGIVTGGTCAAASSGGATSVAFSTTQNANGGSISGGVLTLAEAGTTNPGLISGNAQTFNGQKTFNGQIIAPSGLNSSGAAISLNNNSNFAVNIGTGTSTGLVSIGGGAGTFALNTTNIDISAAGAITGATGLTFSSGAFLQSGSGSFTTGGGANVLSGSTIGLGDASTDRLSFVAQILGASPFVFQGATDNGFVTTLSLVDPTANRTITLPNASGTVAVSASGNVALDAAGNITLTGQVGVGNGGTGLSSLTANGVVYGTGSGAAVTAAGTTGQCLISTTGAAPSWGTCGSGNASTLQDAYDGSGGTANPHIQLATGASGLKIRDNATPVTGNLFQIQNSGGTATYFGIATAGLTIQNSSAVTLLNFDTSTSKLRIAKTGSAYVDIYDDGTNAFIQQSSGTLNLGLGSGNINFDTTAVADTMNATKTATLAAAYSGNTFSITEALTGGANGISGTVLNVGSNSTTTGTNSENILKLNRQNGTGGNLILAQTAGTTTRFQVTDTGNLTASGTISGTTITGSAGGSLNGGTVNLNTTGAGAVNIGNGAFANAIAVGSTTSGSTLSLGGGTSWNVTTAGAATFSSLTVGAISTTGNFGQTGATNFSTGTGIISLNGNTTIASGKILTLGLTTADPSGTNGAMYYNSSSAKFRCFQGAWKDCLSPWTLVTKTANQDVSNTTTFGNDTALQFPVTAGTTYVVRFYIVYSGNNAATDYESQFLFPANASAANVTGRITATTTADVSTGNSFLGGTTTTFPDTSKASGVSATITQKRVYEGYFSFQPQTSGTMNYQFALSSAGTGIARTNAGSFLEYQAL